MQCAERSSCGSAYHHNDGWAVDGSSIAVEVVQFPSQSWEGRSSKGMSEVEEPEKLDLGVARAYHCLPLAGTKLSRMPRFASPAAVGVGLRSG